MLIRASLAVEADDRVRGAGSFIRLNKKTDGETSFLDALKSKYASHGEYERVVLDSSGKEIEMVGFEKIEQEQRCLLLEFKIDLSNLHELKIVVLDMMLIRYANSFSEIKNICPSITSLDLSRNLISELSTIAKICSPLSELRILRLTGNRFSCFTLESDVLDAFQNIEWLGLNMCALSWTEIQESTKWFTKLQHLEIAFNNLTNPITTVRLPESVDTLILESNEIKSLECLDLIDAPGYHPIKTNNNYSDYKDCLWRVIH